MRVAVDRENNGDLWNRFGWLYVLCLVLTVGVSLENWMQVAPSCRREMRTLLCPPKSVCNTHARYVGTTFQ